MDYRGAVSTDTLLVVDAENVEFRQGGPAIGGVWLVTEGDAFPQVGWSDFVVVLLCWWAGALLKVIHNEDMQTRVPFMDGPYAVDVARSFGMLKFRMIARDREVSTGEAAVKPFVVELASQSHRVLDTCRSKEWWSTDADALESLLEELEREIRRL
jgi:hypothetical protein